MCHCGLYMCLCVARMCACVFTCQHVHGAMCKPAQTDRHISFIGPLLLFCFGGLSVLVHAVSPWPHVHYNMSVMMSHLAPSEFPKDSIDPTTKMPHFHLFLMWLLAFVIVWLDGLIYYDKDKTFFSIYALK